MKKEQTVCPETSEYKIHTPGNYPEESNLPAYEEGTDSVSRNVGI